MSVFEVIEKRRSCRRFTPQPVDKNDLFVMIQAARLAPQAANIQPIRYAIVHQPQLLEPMFSCTKWAGYLADYAPPAGYRPTGYIVILLDDALKGRYSDTDAGAAVENMLLVATEKGLGTCWLGAVDRDRIRKLLGIPEGFSIHSVVAVGYPAQAQYPSWEEKDSDSIRYYLDENGKLHVPKRRMGEVLVPIMPDLSDFKQETEK